MANGSLGQKGEHDWLAVTLSAGQAYEFTITGLSNYAQTQVSTRRRSMKASSPTRWSTS